MSGVPPRARRPRVRALSAVVALLGGLGLSVAAAPAASAQATDGDVLPVGATASSRNVSLVANLPKTGAFADTASFNSDLAFKGDYAYAGNYNGFTVYDISNKRRPREVVQMVCPGSQNDVSVLGRLLFLSVDSRRNDDTCSSRAATGPESAAGTYWEGIRIFDISNPADPRYVKSVETDCGSHTHTLVPAADGKDIYVYVSSYGPSVNIARCQPPHDKISIVKVPVLAPTEAAVVATPVLFPDGGNPGTRPPSATPTATTGPTPSATATATASPTPRPVDSAPATPTATASPTASAAPTSPTAATPTSTPPPIPGGRTFTSATAGCHDITAYPAKGIAAGACMGEGVIMDIRNPVAPRVVETVRDDENFAFWHSATFSNAADKVVFTDELGGGGGPTCNPTTGRTKGADAIYTLDADRQLTFGSYYKIEREQLNTENCVAHNGSLIPAKNGRDIMVQAWYQGGISIFDFTDPRRPEELGWFDRGALSGTELILGGSWSAYYYDGFIFSNDIQRGLDVLQVRGGPTDGRRAGYGGLQYNPQTQPQLRLPTAPRP